MKKLLLPLLIVLCLGISACSTPAPTEIQEKQTLNVVSTTGMINDLVINIGGEHVTPTSLMGPGVDPHLYKPTQGDVARLSNADVILYNGLHLEAQMGEVLAQMSNKLVVAVGDSIDESLLLEGDGGYSDPHIWFDVQLWTQAATAVEQALIQADQINAEYYQQNAEQYRAQLQALDQYVTEQAELVPEESRVLITAHDAFGYFGEAYGFEVRGLQGISTQSEAGTKDVQELVDFIVARQIKAIFVESSIPKRNVQAVQEAAQAKGWDVQVGGELFSDAMGDQGTPQGTYLGMVKHNIDTISGALS